jgi:hypothetical protein
MAVAALVLALFSLGAAMARDVARQALLRAEARAVAESWLALIRAGDLPAAHQMTLSHRERQQGGVDLKAFYGSGPRKDELPKYFASPPLDRIVKHAPHGQFQFEQDVSSGRSEHEDYLDQAYRLQWQETSGEPREITFRIVLERTLHPTLGHGRWRVHAVTANHKD